MSEVPQKQVLVIDAYFSATKIRWILDQVEGAQNVLKRRNCSLEPSIHWLVLKLTDGASHVTELFKTLLVPWTPTISQT